MGCGTILDLFLKLISSVLKANNILFFCLISLFMFGTKGINVFLYTKNNWRHRLHHEWTFLFFHDKCSEIQSIYEYVQILIPMYGLFLRIKIIIFNCAKVEPNIICHEKGGQIPLGYADKCWLSLHSIKKH